MKFYVPPKLQQDFRDWLHTDVENANYDFQIIRNWYQQTKVALIRALFFPISWKSKILSTLSNHGQEMP